MSTTTSTAAPRLTVRTAKTPQELLMALLALNFVEVAAEDNQIVQARAIIGNSQLLPAKTANGIKGRLVVSTTCIVNGSAFAQEFQAFKARVMQGSYGSVKEAQQAFYELSEKFTVRAIIWEDTPNFEDIRNYGEIKGILRQSGVYTDKHGVQKQSWELIRVTSALEVAKGKAFKLGDYDAVITDNSGGTSSTPVPPPPTPTPVNSAPPVMKALNGQPYTVESLLAAGWRQADIDALPNM